MFCLQCGECSCQYFSTLRGLLRHGPRSGTTSLSQRHDSTWRTLKAIPVAHRLVPFSQPSSKCMFSLLPSQRATSRTCSCVNTKAHPFLPRWTLWSRTARSTPPTPPHYPQLTGGVSLFAIASLAFTFQNMEGSPPPDFSRLRQSWRWSTHIFIAKEGAGGGSR